MTEPIPAAEQVDWPSGDEIYGELPLGSAVDEGWIDGVIAGQVAKLVRCYSPEAIVLDEFTRSLVWDYAYARALKHHFTKGEAAIQTPVADTLLTAARDAINSHCVEINAAQGDTPGDAVAREKTRLRNVSTDSLWPGDPTNRSAAPWGTP